MIKDNENMVNVMEDMAKDMEANHILSTFTLDTLPDDVGEIEVNLLDGEAYYDYLVDDGENFVFKLSFFKESGKWYATEYFSIQGLDFTANEIYKGYAKASYHLHQAIRDFAKTGYKGYKGMTAVLDFPAFYPSLFAAEERA